jgi:hypothetical protein
MSPRRLASTLLLAGALAAVPAAPAAAAPSYRACAGADPANGITQVAVLRTSCRTGLAVARRTNAVKCFLNGTRCTHRVRGRSWTCRLGEREGHASVTCRARRAAVRYRAG